MILYSIAPLSNSSDEFASCGEDGTLRIWKGNNDTCRFICYLLYPIRY